MEKAALCFSGGKDSTAVLYWLRDHVGEFDVLFCDTGAILPDIKDFIHATCDKLCANLITVKPVEDIRKFHLQEGFPADIVPVEYTKEFQQFLPEPKPWLVQSYMSCCWRMLFFPLMDYIKQNDYNIVIRGSKGSDSRLSVPDGHVEDGIKFLSPIWDWTDEDVFSYLLKEGVRLPKHYSFFNDSLDCYLCTGHMKYHGAERLQYIKKFWPQLWPEVETRLKLVGDIVGGESATVANAFLGGYDALR